MGAASRTAPWRSHPGVSCGMPTPREPSEPSVRLSQSSGDASPARAAPGAAAPRTHAPLVLSTVWRTTTTPTAGPRRGARSGTRWSAGRGPRSRGRGPPGDGLPCRAQAGDVRMGRDHVGPLLGGGPLRLARWGGYLHGVRRPGRSSRLYRDPHLRAAPRATARSTAGPGSATEAEAKDKDEAQDEAPSGE